MFEFGSIRLRLPEERDLESMRSLRNDPSTWMNLTDVEFLHMEGQKRWFSGLSQKQDRKYFVISDADHDFIGIVRMDEIDRLNRSIRVGCDIRPDLRGKKYGTKTFGAILKYSFDIQNMHRVWLAVVEFNHVGKKLYLSQGFREEGRYRQAIFRDGKYHDYILMSILEEEYRNGKA